MAGESTAQPGGPLAGLTAGSRVAGYQLEKLVGVGGMAAVYRAHSLTCSCQLHRWSSNRSPGSGLPVRASSSPVTVESEAGMLTAIRLPILTTLTGEN